MQIQYCDECGTRVDDAEAVNIAGKYYCRQCAPSHVPAQKGGGTAVLLGGSRSSTRASRPPRTTPIRNLTTGASPLTDGGLRPNYGAPNTVNSDSESENNDDVRGPYTPYPGAAAAAYRWAHTNKAIAISLAAGLSAVLIFTVWTFSNSARKPLAPVEKTPAAPAVPNVVAPTLANEKKTVTNPSESTRTPAIVAIPTNSVQSYNPREEKAIRDLQEIKDLIAGGKASSFEIRRRLNAYVNNDKIWRKSQPFGKEAAQMLEKYKAEKRPADKADGAAPGVTVAVSDDKALDAFNTDFKPVAIKTAKEISFSNAAALKAAFGREVNLALKCTGFIEVPKDGEYTFYVNSDDGSMLYLGDSLLIENGGSHALSERDGTVDLKAGKHAFRLEYYQGIGEAGLILSWSGPGIIKQIVPASALSSVPKK